MADAHHLQSGSHIEPLVISRIFAAPRQLVFKAWSTAGPVRIGRQTAILRYSQGSPARG